MIEADLKKNQTNVYDRFKMAETGWQQGDHEKVDEISRGGQTAVKHI